MLGNFSQTKFTLIPEEAKLTSSVLSPLFSANLGLDIYFQGKEKDRYTTSMIGFAATQQLSKRLKLKWRASRIENNEQELYDIWGAYLFGERSFDKSSADFGSIINPLGAGVFMNHARNKLSIANWNISHKGTWDNGRHYVQWGLSAEKTLINDHLSEWEAQDSAGYNLPYLPGDQLQLSKVIRSSANLDINKLSGYVQDNIVFGNKENFTLQGGVRFNYNSLNKELLVSTFTGIMVAGCKKRLGFQISCWRISSTTILQGIRSYNGKVNTNVKAQKSWQAELARTIILKHGTARHDLR